MLDAGYWMYVSSIQHPASSIQSAMPSLTVENYVKAIYQLAHEADDGAVATGQIAAALGVLPGTVTSMLKTLDESNLATYTPYEGVRLTSAGRALGAARVAAASADRAVSESDAQPHAGMKSTKRPSTWSTRSAIRSWIASTRISGHPSTDPHGDPIPQADGTVAAAADRSLADCAVGDRFRVARVIDQSPEFLRYLSQTGLAIGAQGSLVANDHARERITIRLGSDEKTLSREAAAKLMVR